MLSLQLAIVALATFTNAAPTAFKHAAHEERQAPSKDWVKGARIEGSAILPMRIGLTQNNLEKGEELLMELSHPDSLKYGQYLAPEEVHEIFAPSEESITSVKEWLTTCGIENSRIAHTENKGWLAFDATVEEAERMLLAEFYEHEHKYSPSIRVGTDKYHVPVHLQPHIDYITPGIKLTPVKKRSVKTKRSTAYHSKPVNRLPSSTKPDPDGFPWGYKPPGSGTLPEQLAGCGQNMTPVCIQALYGIPNATKAASGNSLGLYEQGDYFAKSDIDLFLTEYAPWVPQGTYPIPALIDGANFSVPADSKLNSGESDIDIDIAISLLYPQTVTLYQVDDQIYEPEEVTTTNLFNTFLDALDGSYCSYTAYGETGNDPSIDPIYPDPAEGGYKGTLQCGTLKPTNVISASYGQAEADLPLNYNLRQCNEFMKLGLQGISILVASGDYGVASFPGDGSANGCLGPTGEIFNPQYPSGCPWITSVGGTQIYPDQTVYTAESVMHANLSGTAQNFTSAGGFSNYYKQPSYQTAAVEAYFDRADLKYGYYEGIGLNLSEVKGLYNRIGRGYPDVSANGARFRAYMGGDDYHFYGSSLASPTFASVLTLLNEERFAIGKGPIGFVNQVLYQHPEVLNDITNGTNVGCGTEGFHAERGWDPATGLGTPNYPKMLNLFLSLP